MKKELKNSEGHSLVEMASGMPDIHYTFIAWVNSSFYMKIFAEALIGINFFITLIIAKTFDKTYIIIKAYNFFSYKTHFKS